MEFWISPEDAEASRQAAEDLANGKYVMGLDLGAEGQEYQVTVPARSDVLRPDKYGSGHQWIEHVNCHDWNCAICEGGLAFCGICGLVEGQLTTQCIGRELTEAERDRLGAEDVDYKDGAWGPRQYKRGEERTSNE